MSKLRTAVIGVGHQGRWHAEKFAALPASELVGVVDPDAAAARGVAERLGVELIDDYRELVGRVDAVCIASPTSSHFEIASFLLENGVHVLVEKPMTKTLDEAAALVKLAAERDLVLQVGHLERFNPAVMAFDEFLKDPLFIESTRIAPFSERSVDVSVILDLMIHDIDLIQAIVDSDVDSIDASGVPVVSDDIDIANARIRFESGCVANVTASRVSFKTERKLRLFQRSAYVSIDMHQKKSKLYRKTDASATFSPQNITIEEQSFDKADALMTQGAAFLASIAEGTTALVSGEVGMRALQTALAINEIMRPR